MKNQRTGFTLIELLVVIAIIAILAAILFPVFMRAKASGRTAHCVSNMNQIGKALKEYAADYDNYMPPTGYWYGWNKVDERPDRQAWTGRIWTYTAEERRIFICPETETDNAPSYGLCWRAAGSSDYGGSADPFQGHTDYVSSGTFVLVYEVCPKLKGVWNSVGDWDMTNEPQTGENDTQFTDVSTGWNQLKWPGPHNGGHNILFGDGHVKMFHKWEPENMSFNPALAD